MNGWLSIYLMGLPIFTLAYMDKAKWCDFLASAVVAALWPLTIPVAIVLMIFRTSAIDLRTCKTGDRLKLRDGTGATYLSAESGEGCCGYPHLVDRDGMWLETYSDGGLFNRTSSLPCDVAEIAERA